ncbi:MAG: glycoside hydrolase [Cyanobacteria bacterium HKST-UBA03]|nr:glycoside hydrolase [Cyanobacteria bacterium HKST-UBA03]
MMCPDASSVDPAAKQLHVAFVWHMHQPDYKNHVTGQYQMPWVRFHAIKDYTDMALKLEQYPKLGQTFNLVPSLMRQLEDYAAGGVDDPISRLCLKDDWDDEDKQAMLDRFFDATYTTMVSRSKRYSELFHRRNEGQCIHDFTAADYGDLAALFNLVWFDPIWFARYDDLNALWHKGQGYTLADRQRILAIQDDIIRQCLPTYKRLQAEGRIEITTTPYYHPILPLLIDSDSAKVAMPHIHLPPKAFVHPEDAEVQVVRGLEYYQSLFDYPPQGMWPSEQSISPAAIDLLGRHGLRWAISSEGNLAASLGISFNKDRYGHITNAHQLCRPYRYGHVTLLFRHLTLSDMIGFDFNSWPAEQAADDMMTRLYNVYQNCLEHGVDYPIVTIALDGENCWESYPNDGHDFLDALYTKLSNEANFNVCRVCDYLDLIETQASPDIVKPLEYLHSGSWIHDNFHIWIGDPVKNAAWANLKRTRDDLVTFAEQAHYDAGTLKKAWEEIYIAEGSDWFWWFGEPHNSGQDGEFDRQFRQHLSNVYTILGKSIPHHLDVPLTDISARGASLAAVTPFSPPVTGQLQSCEWERGGLYLLSQSQGGAMHNNNAVINRLRYGSDHQYAYFRFELNPANLTDFHSLHLYFCTPGKLRYNSPIRLKSHVGQAQGTQRYLYGYEIGFSNLKHAMGSGAAPDIHSAEAIADHLWVNRPDIAVQAVYGDVLDCAIPLRAFGLHPGEYLQFALAVGQLDCLDLLEPSHQLLALRCFSPDEAQGVVAVRPVNEHFQRGGLGGDRVTV